MAWQFAAGEILTADSLDAVTIPWNARCQLARTVVPVAHNTDLVMNFNVSG